MSKITNTSAVHNNGAAELQVGLDKDKFVVKRKGDAVAVVDQDGNKLPIDGASGVYVGEDKIPEGYNVKINPKGAVLKLPTKLGDLEDDIGVISESEKGVAEGVATLGADGKVPESQLPTIDANGAHVGAEPPANTKMVWVDTEDDSIDDANTIVHAWHGTVLEITSDAGTSSADLIGPAGHTPEKGVDYYTEEDKQELIAAVRDEVPTPDVSGPINTHNTATDAHGDIRELLRELSTKINNFLDVDDETADELSEVLTLINNNKGTLESLTTSKVNVSDIIDNLTTNDSSKVLSAAQGVALKALIDALQTAVTGKASTDVATTSKSGLLSATDKVKYDSYETSKAPAYTYGTEDLTAGTSPLETGTLYFCYE